MSDKKIGQDCHGRLTNSLLKVDSSIRNGQFVYAYREAKKLYAEVSRGEVYVSCNYRPDLLSSIKRTIMFLKPVIDAYSQNTASLEIARRSEKCRIQQPNP